MTTKKDVKSNESIDPVLYDLFEYRPRKGDIKKVEIIKAAIECLGTIGLENTTFEAIAKRIGTRRAHVAYHFSEKQSIFYAAVKYILATFQQLTIHYIQHETDGRQMLIRYIDAAFDWAKNYPDQLSVMLLLYYYCTIKPEYRKLHDKIRTNGVERISYILTNKCVPPVASDTAKTISKHIQNLISGGMMDVVTTNSRSLDEAKADAMQLVLLLLQQREK